jgi:hypothetical protein
MTAVRLAMAAWAGAVVAGLFWLGYHAASPGDSGDPAERWPTGSRIAPANDRPSLLLFVNNRCPCTRASLVEFERLLARSPVPLAARIVRVLPDPQEAGKSTSPRTIPGVPSFDDEGGVEARRFGVATSGHALLFDRAGRLLFSGGITPARGHEGDSLGRDALLERVAGTRAYGGPARSPVFGCPLTDPDSSLIESKP